MMMSNKKVTTIMPQSPDSKSANLSPPGHPDTPVGHVDKSPKVQLCLEIREKKGKSKSKPTQEFLEVTVLYVKYLPKTSDSQLVKLRLHHQLRDEIKSTDLTTLRPGTIDARYIEVISFSINTGQLKGTTLLLQVCDKKALRHTKPIGQVQIDLDRLRINKPLCQWFNLDTPDTS